MSRYTINTLTIGGVVIDDPRAKMAFARLAAGHLRQLSPHRMPRRLRAAHGGLAASPAVRMVPHSWTTV